ncbi:hypothetical protein KDA82_29320, partial [Streptomyces daliensis]|nr:hypothetical protein [Streptomyces daliensis]
MTLFPHPEPSSPAPSSYQVWALPGIPGERERLARHRGGGLGGGHHRRPGRGADGRLLEGPHGVGVDGVHEPAVEQPRAVVLCDGGGGGPHADGREHLVRHAAHGR